MRNPDYDTLCRFLKKLWKADTPHKLNRFFSDELSESLPVRSTATILKSAPAAATSKQAGAPLTFDDLSAGLQKKGTSGKIAKSHADFEKLSALLGRGVMAIYTVPLIEEGSIVGILIVGTSKKSGFSAKEKKTLSAFGKMASTAVCLSPLGGLCVAHAPWDSETGTYNNAFFDAMLAEEIKRADRDHHEFCLIYLCLAGYADFRKKMGAVKLRNALGHVISALRAKLRDHDVVGRIDDETFGVILPGIGAATGKTIANRILRDITRLSIQPSKKGSALSPGCGLAVYPKDASFKTVLIEAAEMAVEAATARKKPAVVVFS
ncbi:MAG: GGDEF domain-containing protein [Planctomycetota bacterium]|jgi:diguanylate cyclase (GGDEF)-like protein